VRYTDINIPRRKLEVRRREEQRGQHEATSHSRHPMDRAAATAADILVMIPSASHSPL